MAEEKTVAQLAKEHKARVAAIRDDNEVRLKKALQSATVASASLSEEANREVVDVFNTQQKLEVEVKALLQESEQFQKKVQQWSQMFLKFNGALKELGDVTNWGRIVDEDVSDIVTILDAVQTAKQQTLGMRPEQ